MNTILLVLKFIVYFIISNIDVVIIVSIAAIVTSILICKFTNYKVAIFLISIDICLMIFCFLTSFYKAVLETMILLYVCVVFFIVFSVATVIYCLIDSKIGKRKTSKRYGQSGDGSMIDK